MTTLRKTSVLGALLVAATAVAGAQTTPAQQPAARTDSTHMTAGAHKARKHARKAAKRGMAHDSAAAKPSPK